MKRIEIHLQHPPKDVEIILSPHLLMSDGIVNEIRSLSSRFALFCDDNVAEWIGKKWHAHLQNLGLDVSLFTFPPGEQEKSRERKAELEDLLFSQQFSRDTALIALGGGVTTDLIGFLASTFCRGVPLINIPTTLLGMVDAAVGGKTGVNTRFGKNLIGTFYPADKILIDPTLLNSLPTSEWTNGAAEIIKYALIHSPQLFQTLKKWTPDDPAYLEKIIHECILIKLGVVEKDYEEQGGLRRILNFGHTIAHALERIENYQISHGEAVAIGMLVECHLSLKMGLLPETTYNEIAKLIRSFPFPLKFSEVITCESMLSALSHDKKSQHGTPRFVLLNKIGSCCPFDEEYCTPVPPKILEETLTGMITEFSRGPS